MKRLILIFLIIGIWLNCDYANNDKLDNKIDSIATHFDGITKSNTQDIENVENWLDSLMLAIMIDLEYLKSQDTILNVITIVNRDTIDSIYTNPVPVDSPYIVLVPTYKDTTIYKPTISWTLEPVILEASGGKNVAVIWSEVIDSTLGGYEVNYIGMNRDVLIDVGIVTYWETELPLPGEYQIKVRAYDHPVHNRSEWSRSVIYNYEN